MDDDLDKVRGKRILNTFEKAERKDGALTTQHIKNISPSRVDRMRVRPRDLISEDGLTFITLVLVLPLVVVVILNTNLVLKYIITYN